MSLFFYTYMKMKKKYLLLSDVLMKINSGVNGEEIKKTSSHFVNYLFSVTFPQHFSPEERGDGLYFLTMQYLHNEKKALYIFSSAAALSPLIGLLGTVWGIIHAFMGIASSGAGDLAAVAPGIAEALITTLAGLLVAIPALLFYHIINASYKKFLTTASFIIMFISNNGESHEK